MPTCPKCKTPYKEERIKPRRGMTTNNPKHVPEKPKASEAEDELLEVKIDNEILDTFDLLNDNKISKESIEIIFKQIMSGDAVSVSEAIQNASIKSLTEEELNKILDVIIQDHLDEIKRDGMHSIRSLMGLAMKQVRGQASGNLVNNLPVSYTHLTLPTNREV